jgi:hypothetical protein
MCVGCVGFGLTVRDPLSFSTLLPLAPKETLTLSYSSKINGYLYHKRVSLPLKKMLSEGNAAHPVECDRPLLTIMVRQTAITIRPDHSAEMFAEGRSALEAEKAL